MGGIIDIKTLGVIIIIVVIIIILIIAKISGFSIMEYITNNFYS